MVSEIFDPARWQQVPGFELEVRPDPPARVVSAPIETLQRSEDVSGLESVAVFRVNVSECDAAILRDDIGCRNR